MSGALVSTEIPLQFEVLDLGTNRTAEKARGWRGDSSAAVLREMATGVLVISEGSR